MSREGGKARPDERMDALLKFPALRRIAEDFVSHAAAFRRGDEFMHDVVGVEGLDAKFIQIFREKRLPAGDTASQCYAHGSNGRMPARRRSADARTPFAHLDFTARALFIPFPPYV